jgi:hypothetical protein
VSRCQVAIFGGTTEISILLKRCSGPLSRIAMSGSQRSKPLLSGNSDHTVLRYRARERRHLLGRFVLAMRPCEPNFSIIFALQRSGPPCGH